MQTNLTSKELTTNFGGYIPWYWLFHLPNMIESFSNLGLTAYTNPYGAEILNHHLNPNLKHYYQFSDPSLTTEERWDYFNQNVTYHHYDENDFLTNNFNQTSLIFRSDFFL